MTNPNIPTSVFLFYRRQYWPCPSLSALFKKADGLWLLIKSMVFRVSQMTTSYAKAFYKIQVWFFFQKHFHFCTTLFLINWVDLLKVGLFFFFTLVGIYFEVLIQEHRCLLYSVKTRKIAHCNKIPKRRIALWLSLWLILLLLACAFDATFSPHVPKQEVFIHQCPL